jgi:sugar phosphate isomerase/epimerase
MLMSDLKFGCQTITWGDQQREFLPQVFQATAEAGYAGVEIGFRHIRETPPDELKSLLDQHGLTLVGTHIGGNLQDASQAAGERAVLDEVIAHLKEVGSPRLMYSGLKYDSNRQFQSDLAMLQDAAETCQQAGIKLLYHNHDWEFANDGRIIETLIQQTSIGFCPDIGWVMRGLQSIEGVVPFLNQIADRIGVMHLKDFASVTQTGEQLNTVMLGDGVAPLQDAVAWAKSHRPDLWIVAEQDAANAAPAEVIAANADYVRSLV